jgi:hypothetical protein
MVASNRAHYLASMPLWVVKDCLPEYYTASSKLSLNAKGTGANLINEPLPLLN